MTRSLAALLVPLAILVARPAAQVFDATEGATTDPYTAGDPTRMAELGYQSFGPLALGSWHGSDDVEKLIGPGRMLWLETEHFLLGSPNQAYRIPADRQQRAKLKRELTELRSALPTVDPGVDVLDPWLRLHLLARRCEAVYAEFQEFMGVTDGDFPQTPRQVRGGASFMGLGPYLGTKHKFSVLVFPNGSDLGRYTLKYMDRLYVSPKRYNQGWGKGVAFVTAPDLEGPLDDDTCMHCHIVYSVAHNLIDGYRNWCHDTPVWFKTGFAQIALRKIDPRYPNFDIPDDGRNRGRLGGDWNKIARNLAAHGRATPFAEMATWSGYGEFGYQDFVVAWSRVGFLIEAHGADAFRAFVHGMKDPFGRAFEPPPWEQVLERQEEVVREVFGYANLAELDAAWQDHARRAR